MNHDDTLPWHNGKPPKSAGEIRASLKSIEKAAVPNPVGPYAKELPNDEVAQSNLGYLTDRVLVAEQEPPPDETQSLGGREPFAGVRRPRG